MKVHFLTTDSKITDETARFVQSWEDERESIEQWTSGSTGPPKKIEIRKSLMRSSAKMTGDFFNFSKTQTGLLCISPSFIGGKMMIVRSIEYDFELFATDISSTPLKHLNRPIDFAAMVPLQVSETLTHHPEKLNLISNLIIGGAPVSSKLERALQQVNCKAYSTYGMTETVSHIALKRLNNKGEPFKAIGKTHFSTKDNCLVIHSRELGLDSLTTTDIVELINDTNFNWIGRSDFIINSGGVKIHPEIVEDKLDKLFPKSQFIISSKPDDKLGERVILIAEKKIKPLINEKMIKSKLDKYEIPKEIFYVDQLYTRTSGKVDRKATLKLLNGN